MVRRRFSQLTRIPRITSTAAVALVGLVLAGCDVGSLSEPTSPLVFGAPVSLGANAGEAFSFSFCRPELSGNGALCDSGATNPTGGNPPYHFQLGSGVGFPPAGLTLGLNGILSGTPSRAGASTFSVCAVDESGESVCRTVGMTIVGSVNVGQMTWGCSISADPLPGWRNCTATVSLTISSVITSGYVSVFFNYPTSGAFFHGELAVASSGVLQTVTVNLVNEYVSHCVPSYQTSINVYDGRQNAAQAPLLVSEPMTITSTCS